LVLTETQVAVRSLFIDDRVSLPVEPDNADASKLDTKNEVTPPPPARVGAIGATAVV
jgi:hypothetical protein